MSAAIGVLNAGSSSIKFALFLERGAELELHLRGQLEAIYSAPRFTAKRRDGTSVTNAWLEGTKLGHGGALEYLVEFLRSERLGSLEGVGHRIVHGGLDFAQPVLVDAGVAARLEKLVPPAPLHQPHNPAPIRPPFQNDPELPPVACLYPPLPRPS